MNRLVIIGNGFDLAHGLKTRYEDFINWYWDQRRDMLCHEHSNVSEDILCKLKISRRDRIGYDSWYQFAHENSYFKDFQGNAKITGRELISQLEENPEIFDLEPNMLFEAIISSIETKGWVDIENEYYRLLKQYFQKEYTCKFLNEQLRFLQDKLVEYLTTQTIEKKKITYQSIITGRIKEQDISNEGKEKALSDIESRKVEKSCKWDPEYIMLLSFNYTPTVNLYSRPNIEHNFIHGTLEKPESIIFGFGDELDKDYKSIQEANDNELLTNVKSVRYLEAPNYRNMLRFIESAPFQVFIMGHSCGLSDRTLLNTIFEHKNCISIKPFYYQKEDGTDNYLELVQNISRNFTDMKLFRDRVVNKEQCECM